MLVLTRKYQEKVRIGENITITILRMKGKAVRLGIEAPADVPVIRGELAFEVEGEADDSDSESVESEPSESEKRCSSRKFARSVAAVNGWSTDSNPNIATREASPPGPKSIKFGRVSRQKVNELLPKMISGSAPLKAMMNGR